MLTMSKLSSYQGFCKYSMDNMRETIENHIQQYKIVEELMTFQIWFNNKFVSLSNKFNKENVTKHIISVMYFNNILYAHSGLHSLEKSMYHQSAIQLRVILESLPKMSYLLKYPNEILNICANDKLSIYRRESKTHQKTILRKYLNDTYETFGERNVDEIYRRIQNKYSFRWYVRNVYECQYHCSIFDHYSLLSDHGHGNTMNIKTDDTSTPMWGYNIKLAYYQFEILQALLFYNTFITIKSHKNEIQQLHIEDKCKEFIEQMEAKLASNKNMIFMPLSN